MTRWLSILLLLLAATPALAIERNVAGQKLKVYAHDSAANAPKTGDQANITAYIRKDGGALTALTDTTATQISSSNAAGYYEFDLTQAETDAAILDVTAKSSTSGVVVFGAPNTIVTQPTGYAGVPASLLDVKAITDSFDDLPPESGSPAASGSPAIAQQILSGQARHIIVLGDSVAQNTQQAWNLMLASRFGPRGFSNFKPWTSAGAGCLVQTNDWADFAMAAMGWGEIGLSGGTSDASDTSDANMLLAIDRFGPQGAQNDQADNNSIEHRWSFGGPWMTETLANGDIVVGFPVKVGPSGTVNADIYIRLRNGTTPVAQSDYFSTYAAADGEKWVEIVIPEGTGTLANLNAQVRYRASTAKETGKTVYVCYRAKVENPAATSGSIIWVFAQGGLSANAWAATGSVSDAAISLWRLIDPDLAIIELGLNNPSSNNAATHASLLQTIAGRVRGQAPNAAILYWGVHGRFEQDPNYGGGGPEPYFIEGAYLAQQLTSRSLFINSCKLLPPIRILAAPSPGDFYAWGHLPAGYKFYRGMTAYFGSQLYYAKLDHFRGTATGDQPPNDATNWGLLGLVEDGTGDHDDQRRPTHVAANVAMYDRLHPNLAGGRLLVQTLVDGLYIIRYSSGQGLIAQGVREELSEELARIDEPISEIEAAVDIQPVLDAVAGVAADVLEGTALEGFFDNQPPAEVELSPEQIAGLSADILEALAEQGVVVTPIAATTVLEGRTWNADPINSARAGNIVTVKLPFSGTFKAVPPLNPGADINAVIAVAVTGPVVEGEPTVVETSNIRKSADGRSVLFDVASLTVPGNYSVLVTVSTLDSQEIGMECRLVVR